jgi:hypothetical protein
VFPAKVGQRFWRPAWFTDLCFFLGQYLLWTGLVLWFLTRFSSWLDGIVPSNLRSTVTSQPWLLQAVEVILLGDFLIYWGHRLQQLGFYGGSTPYITAPSIWTGSPLTASIR